MYSRAPVVSATMRTSVVIASTLWEKSVDSGVLVVVLEAGVVAIIALAIYLIRKK